MKTLRAPAVAAKIGVTEAAIWKWVHAGKFPKAIKLAPQVTVWDEADIDQWLQQKKENQHGSSREAEGWDNQPDVRSTGATA